MRRVGVSVWRGVTVVVFEGGRRGLPHETLRVSASHDLRRMETAAASRPTEPVHQVPGPWQKKNINLKNSCVNLKNSRIQLLFN